MVLVQFIILGFELLLADAVQKLTILRYANGLVVFTPPIYSVYLIFLHILLYFTLFLAMKSWHAFTVSVSKR